MIEVSLAVIAVSAVVIAAVQIAAAVVAARAARRINRLASRIEQEIAPVMASLQNVTGDAARVAALAAAQLERADRVFEDFTLKVQQAFDLLESLLLAPVREGATLLNGLKSVLAILRELREKSRKPGATVDDDDALFIG